MLSSRAWVVLLAAVVSAALTARLGAWQLDRAEQKQAVQALLDTRPGLPPIRASDLAHDQTQAQAQHYRRTTLRGLWLGRYTVFLDNRPLNGRVGFIVVTPLRLPDGSAVLVQRGWVPRDPYERTRLPEVASPDGDVQVSGLIAPPPARLYEFDPAASGTIRQNLVLPAFARETGQVLRPVSLLQTETDGVAAVSDGLVRNWSRPKQEIQKHLGYAFQWFALCALIVGLYVWFQLLGPRIRRRA